MTNKNLLLGRPRPKGKLSREEIAALDRVTTPEPRPQPAPEGEKAGVSRRRLRWASRNSDGNPDSPQAVVFLTSIIVSIGRF